LPEKKLFNANIGDIKKKLQCNFSQHEKDTFNAIFIPVIPEKSEIEDIKYFL